MLHSNKSSSSPSDPRVQLIRMIWGCAVGMFALCIPLSALTVRSLEERIANLEAIASHSELDVQHQFKQLELKSLQKYEKELNV